MLIGRKISRDITGCKEESRQNRQGNQDCSLNFQEDQDLKNVKVKENKFEFKTLQNKE